MDPRNKTSILFILFFIFGILVGYAVHKPQTIEKIEYINQTIEVPKIPEEEVEVTITPAATPTATPTTTPIISDFTVKNYDPSLDTPAQTIELKNWRANPSTLSIRSGDTVLIKIVDYTLQSPMTLILNTTYKQNLGTSGAVVVTFNKKGTYNLTAIIPSSDPSIKPGTYAEGIITVY
jgi:hypothetical protein